MKTEHVRKGNSEMIRVGNDVRIIIYDDNGEMIHEVIGFIDDSPENENDAEVLPPKKIEE